MGHGDEQKRRHRPSRDDRSPPRTRPSANHTTPTFVPTTTERSCLSPEKRHSIDQWVEAADSERRRDKTRRSTKAGPTESSYEPMSVHRNVKRPDSSRRHRSREKRPSRSPAPASDPSRHTRDLTRDMSNMALTKGSRSKKPPRGTLHVDERAVSPSVDEGHAWLEGDALTDTPETRMVAARAAARETKRSSKELDLAPFVKGKETSQHPQHYVDYSVERSPSQSPSREHVYSAKPKYRSTGRDRSPPSRRGVQDKASRRDTNYHETIGGTGAPYGHRENREDYVNSRRLLPATQILETNHDDSYALTQSKSSARQYSLSPTPERSSRHGRSGEAVRDRRPEDISAVAASRGQGSKQTVVLEPGKSIV